MTETALRVFRVDAPAFCETLAAAGMGFPEDGALVDAVFDVSRDQIVLTVRSAAFGAEGVNVETR